MDNLETIVITFEDDEEQEFCVLEQTRLMGKTYYLVVTVEDMNSDSDEGECFILKENPEAEDSEFGMYEFVDDDEELESVFPIFEELLGDSDTEVEF